MKTIPSIALTKSQETARISRRDFVRLAGVIPTLLAAPTLAAPRSRAPRSDFWDQPRELWLFRPATREEVRCVYFADGEIVTEGYRQACWMLRDLNYNRPVEIDLVLLDILRGMVGTYKTLGIDVPLYTNSGHRYQSTNDRTEGAAKDSQHLLGRAWDGFVPGARVEDTAAMALRLRGGGVGVYESRSFLHVDSGSLRVWRG